MCDHVAGDVVLRRAQAAAADHRLAPLQRLADAELDALEVVADLDLKVGVDARKRELLADPGRVGIDDLAEQKLGSDGDDFAAHGRLLSQDGAAFNPPHAASVQPAPSPDAHAPS
jgi:hypothetical protein